MAATGTISNKKQLCRNCKSESINNYCSDCGQRVYTKRFTLKSFFFVVLGTLNFEKGFFHTLVILFIHPGKIINHYLSGKTKSYYNPLKYAILLGGLFAFLMIATNVIDKVYYNSNKSLYSSNEVLKEQYEVLENKESYVQLQQNIVKYLKQFMNFFPLLLIPFTSLTTRWFYGAKRLFYGEFLIINCFIFGQTFVISALLLIPIMLIFSTLTAFFPLFSFGISIGYFTYALQKTFEGSYVLTFIKSMLIYVIGALFFYLLLIIIFVIIVFIIKIFKDINLLETLSLKS